MSASQPMDSENKTSHSLDSSFPVGLNEELSFLNESRRPEEQPRSQAFVVWRSGHKALETSLPEDV